MKIGLNFIRIAPNYRGGVNSFAFGLLEGLASIRRAQKFVIFASPHNRHMFAEYEALPNFSVCEIAELNYPEDREAIDKLNWQVRHQLPFDDVNRFLNDEYAQIMDDRVDIHYVPYGPSPLFLYPHKPTIYSIHDVQHLHYPEFFTPEQLMEREVCFRACIAHATLIQASSQHMLEDFTTQFPRLQARRVRVIREGVDVDKFAVASQLPDVRARYNLPDRFLFYPAQLWHHKNHLTVLKALKRLRRYGVIVPLVLTGAKYPGASEAIFEFIENNGLSDQVFYLGLVPSEDIVALYHAARFLITAALYESSSIPVLEAAAAGTPIIASKTPPNIERKQDLQLELFTPTDDEELENSIAGVWANDALIAAQTVHNSRAIQRFRWTTVADDYVTMFENLTAAVSARHAPPPQRLANFG